MTTHSSMRDVIRNNIRILRKEKKLTQQQLAKFVGGKGSGIAKIESGQIGVSEAKLKKIADALNVEYSEFLKGINDKDDGSLLLTDEENDIIKKIRTMSEEHRVTVLDIINTFIGAEK